MGVVPKTAGLVSPGGKWTIFSLGTKSVAHHDLQRSSPKEQPEVPHPPARVDPDGRVYQAGIRTVHPIQPKEKPAVLSFTCPCIVCTGSQPAENIPLYSKNVAEKNHSPTPNLKPPQYISPNIIPQ